MILPTSYSPMKPVVLHDGLSLRPLTRGVIEMPYSAPCVDTIRLEGYEKTEGALKSWVIFHTFLLNSRQTAEQYEWSYGGGRKLELTDEKLVDGADYDHILPWVFRGSEAVVGEKDASYAELYEKYKALSAEKVGIVRNYLNDFSKVFRARNIKRAISDPSYWQMMVYYSVIEKILGRQKHCTEQHSCEKCGTANIGHYVESPLEWTRGRLREITGSEQTAEAYLAVVWAVRERIRHSTVHSALVPTAEHELEQEEDRVLFDLERSIGNYKKDHLAVESLIQMLADVARYLLLDDIYHLKIFPAPRPLGVITLRQPGVPVRGI